MISLDNFYKGLGEADHNNAENYDFDHPSALDMDLAFEKLQQIKDGRDIEIPTYDFALHARTKETRLVKAAPVVIFEGILSLYEEKIRSLMDLKIFVLTDMDICLSRRLLRDIHERGRSVHSVLVQYNRFVKNSFESFIEPTMKHCDIIIPNERNHSENQAAVEFLLYNLTQKLAERRKEMTRIAEERLRRAHQERRLQEQEEQKAQPFLEVGEYNPESPSQKPDLSGVGKTIAELTEQSLFFHSLDSEEQLSQVEQAQAKQVFFVNGDRAALERKLPGVRLRQFTGA